MLLSSVSAACHRAQTTAFRLSLACLLQALILVLLCLTQCLALGKNLGIHSLLDAAFADLTWGSA